MKKVTITVKPENIRPREQLNVLALDCGWACAVNDVLKPEFRASVISMNTYIYPVDSEIEEIEEGKPVASFSHPPHVRDWINRFPYNRGMDLPSLEVELPEHILR